MPILLPERTRATAWRIVLTVRWRSTIQPRLPRSRVWRGFGRRMPDLRPRMPDSDSRCSSTSSVRRRKAMEADNHRASVKGFNEHLGDQDCQFEWGQLGRLSRTGLFVPLGIE
mmetsp:Transcript_21702/g.61735  ORF Transcript_21702/g.61735 Transcript_21702/m.61735 type:complete len:113 (+) Transcript_21702:100-438(+)